MEKKDQDQQKVPEQPMSKSQQKRLAKQKKKAEEKARKEAERAALMQDRPIVEEDPVNPNEYYQFRVKTIKKLKENKEFFPYPHKFQITHLIPKLVEQYDTLCKEKGVFLDDVVSVAGRVHSIREAGKKLVFYDLKAEGAKVQILINANNYSSEEHFQKIKTIIKRGDIIGATGVIGRSKTGELSVQPTMVQLLSPCLHMLPKDVEKEGAEHKEVLTDKETRYRQRYLDLIVNQKPKQIFITRSKTISMLRQELGKRDFLEVETPTLNLIPGGATAKPFETYHNELHSKMFLRIAPELYLKQCIVGGLDRVFEIGKNFRNEGIDLTHNPEFTSCELYWAYADYHDLIKMTEELLCAIVFKIKGSYKFDIINDEGKTITIDFSPPWKKISMMEELGKVLNVTIPEDLSSPEARQFFDDLCVKHKIACSEPRSTSRLIDKLVGEKIEPLCSNPTFLIEQPQIMCPLAKYHRSKPGLTERFELFINQKEFVNAYTELNDPFVQLEQFELQAKAKESGDDEACPVDEEFVKCLEHALPPTAGWGLGIDRLVMLLTNSVNIQEVILFPAMKPKNDHPEEEVKEEKN